MTKLAAIRVRGNTGVRHDMELTMQLLNLKNQHNLVVLDDTLRNRGMLTKVQSFITFGPVSDETLKDIIFTNAVARLHPPRGGFERKGIKKAYTIGGALGYRKDGMDELIRKMTHDSKQAKEE